MKYRKLTGIVLKKQNYKEADQIATVYTQELGKIRCVARALRKSQSRLSGSFQDLSLVSFELSHGKGMPLLISSKTLESFSSLKSDLAKMAVGFYAAEVVIKLTADESANEPSYELLVNFFRSLNRSPQNESVLYALLDCFSLHFLSTLGFSIKHATQSFKITAEQSKIIGLLQDSDFAELPGLKIPDRTGKQIHKIVGQFIEYILERNIKSETFLTSI